MDTEIEILNSFEVLLMFFNNLRTMQTSTLTICLEAENERVVLPRGPYTSNFIKQNLIILINETEDIRRHIRLSRASFLKYCSLLNDVYVAGSWSLEVEILIFLVWLAAGCSYRILSMVTKIPKSTICNIIHRVLRVTISKINQVIKAPQMNQLPEIEEGFCTLAKKPGLFNRAARTIDGCQIEVIVPVNLHLEYCNRKLKTSINSQAVCNHKKEFIDFFNGYPGSVHDSRVLTYSPMYLRQAYPPAGWYLLGDSGYGNITSPIAIVTPFRNDSDEKKRHFNYLHSRARTIVERAFGLLKTRWRMLFQRPIELKIHRAIQVIAACAMLHNICIDANDIIECSDFPEVSDTDENDTPENIHVVDESIRNDIFERI